jgi:hypothetical protein
MQAFIAKARTTAQKHQGQRRKIGSNGAYPGVDAEWSADPVHASAPSHHRIIGGLMVRPDAPSYLLVDPGTVLYWTGPTGSTDDSDIISASTPGLTDITTLVFTPNSGGNTRVDIVECRPVDTATETGVSRDIYNQTTRKFVPNPVTKVSEAIFDWRIRVGTVGVAPTIDPDWIPLAVILVYPSSTNFASCDFYDVRYFADAPNPTYEGGAASSVHIEYSNENNVWGVRSGAAETREYGVWKAKVSGVELGGLMFPTLSEGSFGTDIDYVDIASANNNCRALDLTAGHLNVLCCFIPYQFPTRFVRYARALESVVAADTYATAAITGRFPKGPNGVFATAAKSAIGVVRSGYITPTTSLKASMGFGNAPWLGVQVAEFTYSSSGTAAYCPINILGTHIEPASAGWVSPGLSFPWRGTIAHSLVFTETTDSSSWYQWETTLTPSGTNITTAGASAIPANAKYVDILVNVAAVSDTLGGANEVDVQAENSIIDRAYIVSQTPYLGDPPASIYEKRIRVYLQPSPDAAGYGTSSTRIKIFMSKMVSTANYTGVAYRNYGYIVGYGV